jgi:hypothetical protein
MDSEKLKTFCGGGLSSYEAKFNPKPLGENHFKFSVVHQTMEIIKKKNQHWSQSSEIGSLDGIIRKLSNNEIPTTSIKELHEEN